MIHGGSFVDMHVVTCHGGSCWNFSCHGGSCHVMR